MGEFLIDALKQGLRVDGRTHLESREISISFPHELGNAEGRSSSIMAVVSAEITEPYPDRPTEGFLVFNTVFSPMASPSFEPDRMSDRAIEISKVVERGIRDSRAINVESLCIVAGEKVWSVRCDIHVLDDDGNLVDAVNLAAMAAFKHFRKPCVSAAGDRVIVYPPDQRNPVPLTIHHVPIAVTFGLFASVNIGVLDPTAEEEAQMDGSLTFTVNSRDVICSIQKAGGAPISQEEILKLSELATVRAKEIDRLLADALRRSENEEKMGPGQQLDGEWTCKVSVAQDPSLPVSFGTSTIRLPALHTEPIIDTATLPSLPAPLPKSSSPPKPSPDIANERVPGSKRSNIPPTSLRERYMRQ